MLTFVAFLFALTLLVSVHEWGHYRVAVALGVKVLRFSVGLGKPVWRKTLQRHGQQTEFTIGCLPLGGYVLMLDETNGPVSAQEAPQAFNRQPLWARSLIVLAGPMANLALAVVLLAGAAWWGQNEPVAVLSTPFASSAAAKAGLVGGEKVVAAGLVEHDAPDAAALEPVDSFAALPPQALQAAREAQDWVLEIQDAESSAGVTRRVRLQFAHLPPFSSLEKVSPMALWGLGGPRTAAIVVRTEEGTPAALAGFKPGDLVLKLNGRSVPDAQFLRQAIRESVVGGVAVPLAFDVVRDGQKLHMEAQPAVVMQASQAIGRMGFAVGATPTLAWVEHGVLDSVVLGAQKVAAMTQLTAQMVGELVTGQGSLDQLGGPLSIADQAGRSAQLGFTAYLSFLGFLSISLGVLNLLPLPMLDGGHLMYYLWELLTGKPVSADGVHVLQKVGLMLLVAVMVTALVNDGIRLWR